jgi:hypothetical protein
VTTYFVSKYDTDDAHVGCNDWLGYTTVTFEGSEQPLFIRRGVLASDFAGAAQTVRTAQQVRAHGLCRGHRRPHGHAGTRDVRRVTVGR